jgi:hypothetical protein
VFAVWREGRFGCGGACQQKGVISSMENSIVENFPIVLGSYRHDIDVRDMSVVERYKERIVNSIPMGRRKLFPKNDWLVATLYAYTYFTAGEQSLSYPAKANRNFKDSVFRLYFEEDSRILDAYNAIAGKNYTNADIQFTTIHGALYTNVANDISFTIGGRLVVFVEHQSTINENMPLRFLGYAARVYEELIGRRELYAAKLRRIPKPEFIVLYNGNKEVPDKSILRLSDAFMESDIPETSLELITTVYNIKAGCNKEIAVKSKSLREYASFIARVSDYRGRRLQLAAAIQSAIEDCIAEDIMSDFLKKHGVEVRNMLTVEYDRAEVESVRLEEGKIEGMDMGIEIYKLLRMGETPEQVALKLAVPLDKVQMYKESL